MIEHSFSPIVRADSGVDETGRISNANIAQNAEKRGEIRAGNWKLRVDLIELNST